MSHYVFDRVADPSDGDLTIDEDGRDRRAQGECPEDAVVE